MSDDFNKEDILSFFRDDDEYISCEVDDTTFTQVKHIAQMIGLLVREMDLPGRVQHFVENYGFDYGVLKATWWDELKEEEGKFDWWLTESLIDDIFVILHETRLYQAEVQKPLIERLEHRLKEVVYLSGKAGEREWPINWEGLSLLSK